MTHWKLLHGAAAAISRMHTQHKACGLSIQRKLEGCACCGRSSNPRPPRPPPPSPTCKASISVFGASMKLSSLQQSPAYLSAGSSSTSSIMAATMSASAPLMKPRPAAPLPPPLPLPRPRPAANPAPPFCRCEEQIGALGLGDSTSSGGQILAAHLPHGLVAGVKSSWQASCHSQDGLLLFSLPCRQTGAAAKANRAQKRAARLSASWTQSNQGPRLVHLWLADLPAWLGCRRPPNPAADPR